MKPLQQSCLVPLVDDDGRIDILVGGMTAGGWKSPMNRNPWLRLYHNESGLKFTRQKQDAGWDVHELKLAPATSERGIFIYAADEIQRQKFKDMKN